MDPEVPSSRERKSEVLRPDRGGAFVFFMGFVETNIVRTNGKPPTSDLIQSLQSVEELLEPMKWAILDVYETLQGPLRRGSLCNMWVKGRARGSVADE